MSYLVGTGLGKTIDGRTIVDDASLVVERGELVAVVGPNGAGKSTLLAMLAGVLDPTAGHVTLDGQRLDQMKIGDVAKCRAYLPTDLVERLRFTAREVVQMGRHPWSTATEDTRSVDDALQALDLGRLAGHVYSTLSTGEARRTQIARILAQDTPALLLDEPTSGLDIAHTELVLTRLRGLVDSGRTVVMVVHDLNAAVRTADRVVVMQDGHIAVDGRPDDVLSAELLTGIYDYPIGIADNPLTNGRLIGPIDEL